MSDVDVVEQPSTAAPKVDYTATSRAMESALQNRPEPNPIPAELKPNWQLPASKQNPYGRRSLTGREEPQVSVPGQIADTVEGTLKVALPAVAIGAIANPVSTAAAIAAGTAFNYGGRKLASALHASPETSRAVGDVAGLAGGALLPGIGKQSWVRFFDVLDAHNAAAESALATEQAAGRASSESSFIGNTVTGDNGIPVEFGGKQYSVRSGSPNFTPESVGSSRRPVYEVVDAGGKVVNSGNGHQVSTYLGGKGAKPAGTGTQTTTAEELDQRYDDILNERSEAQSAIEIAKNQGKRDLYAEAVVNDAEDRLVAVQTQRMKLGSHGEPGPTSYSPEDVDIVESPAAAAPTFHFNPEEVDEQGLDTAPHQINPGATYSGGITVKSVTPDAVTFSKEGLPGLCTLPAAEFQKRVAEPEEPEAEEAAPPAPAFTLGQHVRLGEQPATVVGFRDGKVTVERTVGSTVVRLTVLPESLHPVAEEVQTPKGWDSVPGVQHERHASVDLSNEELAKRAENKPLPLPSGAPESMRPAWDIVSRIVPELAGRLKGVGELPSGSPENAAINVKAGVLRLNPDRPVTPETLWHELIHLDQPTAQGGRAALEPDAFNALEAQARSGISDALDRFARISRILEPLPDFTGATFADERAPVAAATPEPDFAGATFADEKPAEEPAPAVVTKPPVESEHSGEYGKSSLSRLTDKEIRASAKKEAIDPEPYLAERTGPGGTHTGRNKLEWAVWEASEKRRPEATPPAPITKKAAQQQADDARNAKVLSANSGKPIQTKLLGTVPQPLPDMAVRHLSGKPDRSEKASRSLIGGIYRSYGGGIDQILDVTSSPGGSLSYKVQDANTGVVRTHGTFIDPRQVVHLPKKTPENAIEPEQIRNVFPDIEFDERTPAAKPVPLPEADYADAETKLTQSEADLRAARQNYERLDALHNQVKGLTPREIAEVDTQEFSKAKPGDIEDDVRKQLILAARKYEAARTAHDETLTATAAINPLLASQPGHSQSAITVPEDEEADSTLKASTQEVSDSIKLMARYGQEDAAYDPRDDVHDLKRNLKYLDEDIRDLEHADQGVMATAKDTAELARKVIASAESYTVPAPPEEPSAQTFRELDRQVKAIYKSPEYSKDTQEGRKLRDEALELSDKMQFHRPAAIAEAQEAIDRESAARKAKEEAEARAAEAAKPKPAPYVPPTPKPAPQSYADKSAAAAEVLKTPGPYDELPKSGTVTIPNALAKQIIPILKRVAVKSTIPILNNVSIVSQKGKTRITATDLEQAVTFTLQTKAPNGAVTLPVSALEQAIKGKEKGDLMISFAPGSVPSQNGKATLSMGPAESSAATLDISDFQEAPEAKDDVGKIPAAALVDAIKKTIAAISHEESSFTLNGALLDIKDGQANLVATDGHRLSMQSFAVPGIPGEQKFLIPKRTLETIQKLFAKQPGNLTMKSMVGPLSQSGKMSDAERESQRQRYVTFEAPDGSVKLLALQLKGNFPDYPRVIPEPADFTHTATVDREALLDLMKRAVAMKERSNNILLSFRPDRVIGQKITEGATVKGSAPATLVSNSGGEVGNPRIALDAKYVADALNATDAKKVEIQLQGEVGEKKRAQAISVRPAGDASHTTIIMPMRDEHPKWDDGQPNEPEKLGPEAGTSPEKLHSRNVPGPKDKHEPRPIIDLIRESHSKYEEVAGRPVILLNSQALRVFHQAMGAPDEDARGINGFVLHPPDQRQAVSALSRIARRAQGEGADAEAAAEALRDAFTQAIAHSESGGGAAVVRADLNFKTQDQIDSYIREELNHLDQQALGVPHLPEKSQDEFFQSPAAQTAYNALDGIYHFSGPNAMDTAIIEIGARLADPQRHQELGLNDADTKDLANKYVRLLEQSHGGRSSEIRQRVASANGVSGGKELSGVQEEVPERSEPWRIFNREATSSGVSGQPSGSPVDARVNGPKALGPEAGTSPALSDLLHTLAAKLPGSGTPKEKALKANYTSLGALKNLAAGNLYQTRQANAAVDAAAMQASSWKARAATILHAATAPMGKALQGTPYSVPDIFRAFQESRLRGIRDKYETLAEDAQDATDKELDDAYEAHFANLLDAIEGRKEFPGNLMQTATTLLEHGDYDGLRDFLAQTFLSAAQRVTSVMPEDEFDAIRDNPQAKDARNIYRRIVEPAMAQAHREHEGVFTDALGPLDTYFPLIATAPGAEGEAAVKSRGVATRRPYTKPKNPNNFMATGLSEGYSSDVAEFRKRLESSVRAADKFVLLRTMEDEGWLVPMSPGQKTFTDPAGNEWPAAFVEMNPAKTVVIPGHKPIGRGPRMGVTATFMKDEMDAILEGKGYGDPGNALSTFIHKVNGVAVAGLGEPIYHGKNVLGGLVGNTPFIAAALGQKALAALGVKFEGIGEILNLRPSPEEFSRDLIEMARYGIVPDRYGSSTYSKQVAEEMGGHQTRFGLGPLLFGPEGLDIKSRWLLYRVQKQLNPNATPREINNFVNQLGNYTYGQQGKIERWLKSTGLGPFATAGVAGIRRGYGTFTGGPTPGGKGDTYWRIAKVLSTGLVGMAALWAVTYHQLTGHWPWQDQGAKIGVLPIPGSGGGIAHATAKGMAAGAAIEGMIGGVVGGLPGAAIGGVIGALQGGYAGNLLENGRYSKLGRATFGDGPGDGQVNMLFWNPDTSRGLRGTGAAKAFENKMLGGNATQVAEGAAADALNEYSSPAIGPFVRSALAGVFGKESYLTGMRDDRGNLAPSFFPAVPKKTNQYRGMTGLPAQAAWRAQAAIKEMNPFYHNLALGTGLAQANPDEKGDHILRAVMGLAAPGLIGNTHNASSASGYLRKQASGMERAK